MAHADLRGPEAAAAERAGEADRAGLRAPDAEIDAADGGAADRDPEARRDAVGRVAPARCRGYEGRRRRPEADGRDRAKRVAGAERVAGVVGDFGLRLRAGYRYRGRREDGRYAVAEGRHLGRRLRGGGQGAGERRLFELEVLEGRQCVP